MLNSFWLIISFIISHIFLLTTIQKIIIQSKLDNDLLFIYLSNMFLIFTFIYFFIFINNYFLSFFISLFLMIFSYLLVYHIKNIIGKYALLTFPHFLLCVYIFANLLIYLTF